MKKLEQSDFSEQLMVSTIKPFKKARGDKRPTVVSLFSGAGGLDMGFYMEGFNIVWANDFDPDACETYKANIGDHIRCGDVKKWMYELHQFSDRVDLLIGGPPCQGFSVAGKMNPNDPRSENVWNYVKALGIVRPRAFVMENVKALGVLEKWGDVRARLLEQMRGLGYNTNFIVVNSSDYDVPQNRERVLFIGFKDEGDEPIDLESLLSPYKMKSPTVKEVLSKLDRPGVGNNTGVCNAKITFAVNPIMRKSPYAGMIFNGLGRPIRVNGYCATLPASMGGNKTPIIDEEELYDGKPSWVEEYHKGLMDGSVVPVFKEAPKRLRRLTVEEAAAIQTFPLGYNFVGSRVTKYRQIGNAVPCNLARQVARMLKDKLNK